MKILTYDIETAPKIGYIWGLFKQNVPLSMLLEDGYIISWAAKWHGDKTMHSDGLHNYDNKVENQGLMVEGLFDLMNEADVLVGYNSDKFDQKHMNTAFLMAGKSPPIPSKSVDLYKVTKARFNFTSNKLEFIAKKLGIKQKLNHRGFALWDGYMNDDEDCWKEMLDYNEQDVEVTEELFDLYRDKGWIKNMPSHPLYAGLTENTPKTCNNCGGTSIVKKGIEHLKVTSYQRYKCNDCGNNMRGRQLLSTKAERDSLLINI